MKTDEKIRDMTTKLATSRATSKEVGIATLQILSSMYNEAQRDREHLNRIEEKIDAHNKIDRAEHIQFGKKLDEIVDKVDYHDFVLRAIVSVLAIVTSFGVYRILSYLFG
jgi:hypothetical protein